MGRITTAQQTKTIVSIKTIDVGKGIAKTILFK